MSTTDAEVKTTPPAAEAAEEVKAPTPTAEGSKEGSGGSSSSGLWGWRNRLMNWRGGSDDKDKEEASAATTAGENTTPSATATEEGKEATTTTTHNTATPPATSTTRPMNIWLRRALERQAESAIAEALRDGKPLPTTTTAIPVTAASVPAAAENAKTEPASAAGGVATEASDSVNATAVSPAPQRISFADLMRQHREGLLAPSAQPAVKATKVVKKPKTATAAAEASAEAASTTPTSRKRKTKAEAAPAASEGKDETDTEAAATAAAAAAVTTVPAKSKSEAGTSVHNGAVHKRVKAGSPLNSASARRTQGTSAEVSAAATPTQTTTVKGKLSLEEMRARRNRTTASAHNTPSPLATAAEDAAGQRVDGYNEGALDAISQLLLRYCLGDPTKTTAGAPAEEAAEATSSELVFFNQLMELCESNSLTPESLELLRELFQHVRVLPRPNTTTTTTTPAAAAAAAAETSPDAAVAEEATADAAVAQTTMDAEAYREASRRREYVQQVIMVLINRLKQLKLQEQQREQRRQEHAAVAAGAPQAVVGHTMPSIRVGGVPLNPLPTTTTTTTTMPNTTNTTSASTTCSSTQPPPPPTPSQTSAVPPAMLSYDEQMRHLAEWRAMAELASGDGGADEAAAAAAFASTMAAHGYPNPYAHLTVFSQHQPVAPPVGWPSASTSSSRGSGGGPGAVSGAALRNSVAARLMPSPFPGAFPIIPPPSSTRGGGSAGDGVDGAGAKEEREMQELFRLIRHQLTQPAHTRSTDAQSTTSPGPAATATSAVDVSQAERAILRHVQQDFKQHQQQQQQQQQSVGNSPAAAVERPTASTPPTTSLDAPSPPSPASHRTLFTPQGKRRDGESEAAAAGAGATPNPPSTRSATASPAPEEAEAEKKAEAPASSSAATALNVAAKPFVPGQPAATVDAPTAAKRALNLEAAPFVPAGDGAATPPRTTIRYEAKPFHPGAATSVKGSTVGAAPASTMRAQAKAFVPAPQQQQQSTVSASPAVPSHARNYAAAADMRGANLGGVPGSVDPAADPWASYEMFARWRDMMEVYYQGVFAGQQAANGASSSLATPPRRS